MKKITKIFISAILGPMLVTASVNAEEIDYKTYFKTESVSFEETDDKIIVLNEDGEELFSANEVNDTVYVNAKAGLNLRSVPTTTSDEEKAYKKGTAINRVGDGDRGWDIVEIEGKKYFMWDEYLSKEKPVEPVVTESQNTVTLNNTNANVDVSVAPSSSAIYSPGALQSMGVIYWGGWRWTWYSQNVLPGGGLNIPGRHVDENGYVCDGDGYICLASSVLAKGTVVNTPFGKPGKVYDSGCAADTLDVYTNF